MLSQTVTGKESITYSDALPPCLNNAQFDKTDQRAVLPLGADAS
jgi:hypothetical protein